MFCNNDLLERHLVIYALLHQLLFVSLVHCYSNLEVFERLANLLELTEIGTEDCDVAFAVVFALPQEVEDKIPNHVDLRRVKQYASELERADAPRTC